MLNQDEIQERKEIIKQLKDEIKVLKKEKKTINQLIKDKQEDIECYKAELENM